MLLLLVRRIMVLRSKIVKGTNKQGKQVRTQVSTQTSKHTSKLSKQVSKQSIVKLILMEVVKCLD